MKRFLCFTVCLLISVSFACVALGEAVSIGYQPLQRGDTGEDVMRIQEQLNTLGYYSGKINGIYLDGIEQAVIRFQQDYELEETGTVNGETEAALFNAEYRELTTGDSGDDVKRIQARLIALDYYNGKLSGDYLEGTTFGIKLFQENNGLEATGTADIETQRKLFSDSALSRFAKDGTAKSDIGDINDIVIASDGSGDEETTNSYDMEYAGKITRGTQGNRVKQIQQRLTELGYFNRSDQRQLYEPNHRSH